MCGGVECAVKAIAPSIKPVYHAQCRLPSYYRQRSTDSHESSQKAATATLSARWLSDVKQRIGKCMTFGLQPEQTEQAGNILHEIARDWRELVAGSEGFLTGPSRRGMHRQEVVWGEMDSMVRSNLDSGDERTFSTWTQG